MRNLLPFAVLSRLLGCNWERKLLFCGIGECELVVFAGEPQQTLISTLSLIDCARFGKAKRVLWDPRSPREWL